MKNKNVSGRTVNYCTAIIVYQLTFYPNSSCMHTFILIYIVLECLPNPTCDKYATVV